MAKTVILGTATADDVFVDDGAGVRRLYTTCGGAPFYAGRALTSAGHSVVPLIALGDDSSGAAIRNACHAAGLGDDGIDIRSGEQSPSCRLVYASSGEDRCDFDAGDSDKGALTSAQLALLDQAELVVIAAAPAARIEQTLAQLRPDQRVAWVYKDDPACFPEVIGRALIARATWLFHNRAEADRIAALTERQEAWPILFHTCGHEGVIVTSRGGTAALPVARLEIADPTGAGDSFAGYALAALLGGAAAPAAARYAIKATAQFLAARHHASFRGVRGAEIQR